MHMLPREMARGVMITRRFRWDLRSSVELQEQERLAREEAERQMREEEEAWASDLHLMGVWCGS